MFENLIMSEHCKNDHLDRMVYIATTIGWGSKIMVERKSVDRTECLTDTGVIMIMTLDHRFLITAYIASIDRAVALYRSAGKNARMPSKLYDRVVKNKKYHKGQNGA